jgi:centrosomal protein CEP104
LEQGKERAVKNEDFEEAKRIKEAIERLKHIGAQLQHLEERKNTAIQNEDYDAAKVIKEEIERLRYAVAPQSNKYLDKPVVDNSYQIKEQRKNIPPVKEPQIMYLT